MEETAGGIIWSLPVILGPLVLGLAMAYAALRWRRRRRLRPGETRHDLHDMIAYGLPVLIALAILVYLMLLPGSS
jgi:hypothetical protein